MTPVDEADIGVASAVAATGRGETRQAHYLRTIDDCALGMFRLDLDGCITDANRRLLDMLDYDWTELKGKSFNDITHPDDRWIGLEVLLDLRSGREDNVAYEKRFLTQAGNSLWAGVTASATTVDGVPIGVMLMVTDLSVRCEPDPVALADHGLLKTALSIAPIIVFACDNDGILILCEDTGLDSPQGHSTSVGRHVWDVYADTEDVREHMQRGLAGESGAFLMVFNDAEFNCRYRPIEDMDGKVLGVAGLAQDVTALTNLRTENDRLSEFMTTLSHELRNPLQAILGFTELLVTGAYGKVGARQKRPLGNIEVGGRQLLSLVNDILDLAQIKAGHLRLEETELEAGKAIRSLTKEMSASAEAKGVHLVEVAGPALEFRADGRRVHQVLLNLLSNAIKFTPAGGTIELSFNANAAGNPQICVSDDGGGLAPDELRLIFEEFGQVAAHRAGNPSGLGLGLPVSRKLATAMGGTLLADSTVGVGSKFCLTLPRTPAIPQVG
jgi:two-component system, chemotaxis family, CheB/CheR fusion protein